LKGKIGKFMERKECNAEGKTSACQKPSFISDVPPNIGSFWQSSFREDF
jgi:hypothetical protein